MINSFTTLTASIALSSGIVLASIGQARAISLSFSGSLATDDDVSLFNFTVSDRSQVTIETLSYGGGTLNDGTELDAGGFDPILSLFDSSGSFINFNDDSGFGQPDPVTGGASDAGLRPILDPGNYTVAITQFGNFFNFSPSLTGNLSDGFSQQGQPNFTSIFGCDAGQFCDTNADSRTNKWVTKVQVPEPSSIMASGLLLGLILAARKKRQQS
ncbi:MAG: DVUA0089 family protein [Cyanobacteria bacterium P01_A01_bin.17]